MKIITLLFFLMSINLYSQENKFTVFGSVRDCRTKQPIQNVTLKLIGSDKSFIETKSDSSGTYSFYNCFKSNVGYTLTTYVYDSIGRSKAVKYGICPGEFYEKSGYLNSCDKYKFTYSDTLKKILKYDFCLTEILACGPSPTFYFKKNSSEFVKTEWLHEMATDTAIDCFVSFLIAHNSLVLEIAGNASADEKNKKELALSRAEKLFYLLVSKGIDKERLVCRSYSDSKPYMSYNENGQLKNINVETKNEKSRRISISLLRKDYDPKGNKNNDEE